MTGYTGFAAVSIIVIRCGRGPIGEYEDFFFCKHIVQCAISLNTHPPTFIMCTLIYTHTLRLRPSLMDSKLCHQNFDLAKFQEIIRRNPCNGAFFFGTWTQNYKKNLSRRLSSNSAQNFGQIPSRALRLTIFSELHLEVVAPRFEEIQGRQTGRQQTLAFRYRRRSPPELGYGGECPTYRPLQVLSLSLSIWSDSALCDVATSKTAYCRLLHTPYNKNALKNEPCSSQPIFEISRPCAGEAGL